MTVLRDPIIFSQELGYYKQMAQGHLEEMKSILEREGGGFFPMWPTSIPHGTPACADCCRTPSAGGA